MKNCTTNFASYVYHENRGLFSFKNYVLDEWYHNMGFKSFFFFIFVNYKLFENYCEKKSVITLFLLFKL